MKNYNKCTEISIYELGKFMEDTIYALRNRKEIKEETETNTYNGSSID